MCRAWLAYRANHLTREDVPAFLARPPYGATHPLCDVYPASGNEHLNRGFIVKTGTPSIERVLMFVSPANRPHGESLHTRNSDSTIESVLWGILIFGLLLIAVW